MCMIILIVSLTLMSDCNPFNISVRYDNVDLLNPRRAVIIQCWSGERHHCFSCMAENGCFAAHFFHPTILLYPYTKPSTCGLNDRALNLSLWMDQEGTVGWHLLALSHLPRYQAGVEQNLSQKPWRGCSVENKRWNPTAKRQLAGKCCYEGESWKGYYRLQRGQTVRTWF